MQLQALLGGEQLEAIKTVVTNLIGRKQLVKAKLICDEFSRQSKDEFIHIQIRRLQKEIINAEFSNFTLKREDNEDKEIETT